MIRIPALPVLFLWLTSLYTIHASDYFVFCPKDLPTQGWPRGLSPFEYPSLTSLCSARSDNQFGNLNCVCHSLNPFESPDKPSSNQPTEEQENQPVQGATVLCISGSMSRSMTSRNNDLVIYCEENCKCYRKQQPDPPQIGGRLNVERPDPLPVPQRPRSRPDYRFEPAQGSSGSDTWPDSSDVSIEGFNQAQETGEGRSMARISSHPIYELGSVLIPLSELMDLSGSGSERRPRTGASTVHARTGSTLAECERIAMNEFVQPCQAGDESEDRTETGAVQCSLAEGRYGRSGRSKKGWRRIMGTCRAMLAKAFKKPGRDGLRKRRLLRV
ncbi:MAG: hypothetical protein M1824_003481 [Vezdaea acicularis]|nr:MAG: hypothetical protein M1824_003481 [Vezdaea acicularis]